MPEAVLTRSPGWTCVSVTGLPPRATENRWRSMRSGIMRWRSWRNLPGGMRETMFWLLAVLPRVPAVRFLLLVLPRGWTVML